MHQIATLTKEADDSRQTINTLEAELKVTTKSNEQLQRERANLITVAIKCQEGQLKLRAIYGKFKKDSELLALVYGDVDFSSMLPMSVKVGWPSLDFCSTMQPALPNVKCSTALDPSVRPKK